jgi:hypothetical protein
VLWVVWAWVLAVALVVLVALTAGLGVWRSVKTLTSALGELWAFIRAAQPVIPQHVAVAA